MRRRRLKKGPIVIFLILLAVLIVLMINPFNNKKKSNSNNNNNTSNQQQNNNNNVVESKDKKMSIFMVGDVLIHQAVYEDAEIGNGKYDFTDMFSYISPILKNYDLRYCNQESTIGGKNLGISAYPGFNSPDEIGDNLVDMGFNMVSLANNHSLDRGTQAVSYSNSYWKGKNIIIAGTYDSMTERDTIEIHEKNGIKFAFLSYTTISNSNVPNNYILNMYSNERASADVAKAKEQGAEVIIVAMHWGTEYTNEETYSQQQIAEYLSNLGVNLIIGTHSHVVEPINYINDTLVIYSLGNFISNQLFLGENTGTGMMAWVDIVVDEDGKVTFENLGYELILSYMENNTSVADNSRNFKVIPYSKLTDELLPNYKAWKEELESYVERYMEI
jgi:poly-gamma-glutamate synthesis protein (capsule biosynthesis protein)